MKNNYNLADDDIDLIELFKKLGKEKYKIILIIIVSIMIAIGYHYKQPKLYKTSIVLKPVQYKELVKFFAINEFINEFYESTKLDTKNVQKKTYLNEESAIERFTSELMDYEEFIFFLAKTENIKKKISGLSKKDQQKILYQHATSLTLSKRKNSKLDYNLNFVWHDPTEAKEIVRQVLKLVQTNLEQSFFEELRNFKEVRKRQLINKDLIQIEYLKEQSKISKALNIETKQNKEDKIYDRDEFIEDVISLLNTNIYNNNTLTFLRGYKAIEEEIEIIKNRKHVYLAKFEREINNLKEVDLKWVDYNSLLINSKSLNTSLKNLLTLSIGLGLILGVFLVLISSAIKSAKVAR